MLDSLSLLLKGFTCPSKQRGQKEGLVVVIQVIRSVLAEHTVSESSEGLTSMHYGIDTKHWESVSRNILQDRRGLHFMKMNSSFVSRPSH